MKLFIYTFFAFLFITKLGARDPKSYGVGASEDSLCLQLWDEIVSLHGHGKHVSSIPLIDSLNRYARSIDDQQFIAWSIDRKAYIYLSTGELDKAEQLFLEVLEVYEKNKKWPSVTGILTSIIQIQKEKDNYEKAFEYVRKVKNLMPLDTSTLAIYRLYRIQAALHNNIGRMDSAYYFQNLQLKVLTDQESKVLTQKDSMNRSQLYYGMSSTFINIYNYKRAEEHTLLALTYLPAIYKLSRTSIWLSRAQIFLNNNEYDKAKAYAFMAKEYLESVNHEVRLIAAYTTLATIFLETKEYVEAKKYLDLVKIDEGYKNKEVSSRYVLAELELSLHLRNQLSLVKNYMLAEHAMTSIDNLHRKTKWKKLQSLYYNLKGNKSKSQEAQIEFHVLKDSLNKIQRKQIIENLEIKYETEQKENKIVRLELEEELNKSQITQQRMAIGGLMGGLALLGLLVFRIFNQNKKIKDQNVTISKALTDKDTLLREIHHRVKNNLQVISSLLGIQSRSIKDEKAKIAILEGKSRVHSMSLIHQNLYKKDNLTGISMPDYIEKLANNLVDTYNTSASEISIETNIENITIDVETVIPLGLIINELITNSLKYAFPENREGKINIVLYKKSDHLFLSVSDNGVGLDADQLDIKIDSFGHTLIRAFKNKLDATIEINSSNGTEVILLIRKFKTY